MGNVNFAAVDIFCISNSTRCANLHTPKYAVTVLCLNRDCVVSRWFTRTGLDWPTTELQYVVPWPSWKSTQQLEKFELRPPYLDVLKDDEERCLIYLRDSNSKFEGLKEL